MIFCMRNVYVLGQACFSLFLEVVRAPVMVFIEAQYVAYVVEAQHSAEITTGQGDFFS